MVSPFAADLLWKAFGKRLCILHNFGEVAIYFARGHIEEFAAIRQVPIPHSKEHKRYIDFSQLIFLKNTRTRHPAT
jgi:hypothetical protein